MKDKTSSNEIISNATSAAQNAAAAALSAADASKTAAGNAAIAAKAAADSATAIAVVATDTSWMKKSLEGIVTTLDEMQKNYVTAAQHLELLKRIDEHETRLNALESSNTKQTVLVSIGIGILSLLISLLIWHILGKS
jgi:hypothetical protein